MRNRQNGFALLIVLWTVGFLALLGTRILAAGRSDTQLADNLKQQAVLEAAADGAIANVMFSVLAAKDPHLQVDGESWTVRIGETPVTVRVQNESDRINLNTASPALLRSLIIDVGGAPPVAERLATAITDWHNDGADTGPDAAQVPQYQAAGLSYGPPATPFQSVDELASVLGMTPDLFARLAPHLTVLSQDDPDMSTHDPVVAQALADSAGVADAALGSPPLDQDAVLRITATAMGAGNARAELLVVASANFDGTTPRISILLRQPVNRSASEAAAEAGS